MIDREKLKEEIRNAFGDVEFPRHCGIRAAELIDGWIDDKELLANETKARDFCGHWWDVPEEHISGQSLGFNYLDAEGVEFYLPAFMVLAINKPIYKNLYTLAYELVPTEEIELDGKGLYKYYCLKYSKIIGLKRDITIKFMQYLVVALRECTPDVPGWDGREVEKALSHEFWRASS
ncbi:hypothetical protein QT397_13155 [Microbulbifer sp. MKSA007]|nr:hypothetical protein QT397_13155 [Microbulbifer sp. MKSA007]